VYEHQLVSLGSGPHTHTWLHPYPTQWLYSNHSSTQQLFSPLVYLCPSCCSLLHDYLYNTDQVIIIVQHNKKVQWENGWHDWSTYVHCYYFLPSVLPCTLFTNKPYLYPSNLPQLTNHGPFFYSALVSQPAWPDLSSCVISCALQDSLSLPLFYLSKRKGGLLPIHSRVTQSLSIIIICLVISSAHTTTKNVQNTT